MRYPILLAFLAGCTGQAQFSASTPTPTPPPPAPAPAPAPAPDPAPPPADPPAEEPPPVVSHELKNLEIQADVIRLKPGIKILFATDSDKLLPASSTILDEVAFVLSQNEKLKLRIEGHTDNAGKAEHNQDLSTRRAAAVKAYLVGKGAPDDRLDSLGCGQGTPIADNATEDGKAQNRRVEFVIIHHRHPRGNCELYKPGEHHHHDHDHDKGGGKDGGKD